MNELLASSKAMACSYSAIHVVSLTQCMQDLHIADNA